MKHHYCNKSAFFIEPESFDKYSDSNFLRFSLGATLYMPANKNILFKVINKDFPGLTSMVMCFEDAISEREVPKAEINVINVLNGLIEAIAEDIITTQEIPLLFIRVRSQDQFINFSEKLNANQIKLITGFVFPKISTNNIKTYFYHLRYLIKKYNTVLYGMPILESEKIAFVESRMNELLELGDLFNDFKDLILNIRVGVADFSSLFNIRRPIQCSIYDILPVRDCLADILNIFSRKNNDYVISAPVWEYFQDVNSHKPKDFTIIDQQKPALNNKVIIDKAIDGLIREVTIDKANGFIGKTIIHPSHIKYVNALYSVTKEEYEDAIQIMGAINGVVKSKKLNKMNEISPHRNWATKILSRAKVYGVIDDTSGYVELLEC